MALTLCKECGKEISTNAGKCPNCGNPVFAEQTPQQLKKKKIDKWIKFIALFIVLFIVYKCFSSQNEDEKQKVTLISKLKEEHCKVDWTKLDKVQKQRILQEFIDNESDLSKAINPNSYKSISMDAYTLLSNSVKYPGTIKVDGEIQKLIIYLPSREAKIINTEKGLIEYAKSFTSENKLGMEVKGTFWLTIKYTAGCKNYEVVDFKVE